MRIEEKEKIVAGILKKIKIDIRELYNNQDNFIPLDFEYRLSVKMTSGYEIEVIPFTKANRSNSGYYFNLDTSWLIAQDYQLQIRMLNGGYSEIKKTLNFRILSNKLL